MRFTDETTPPDQRQPDPDVIAAVDLGSHSFHMIVARVLEDEVRVLDRMRERVRLAASMRNGGYLDGEASKRALACVQQFGERLEHVPLGHVRAVGTNTFRRARNGRAFLDMAEQMIGHPIEIVSGQEEARLIYSGVAHSVALEEGRRLVVDIGGGSTEFILGSGFDVLAAESVNLGCVIHTQRWFPEGRLSRKRVRKAVEAAKVDLAAAVARFTQSHARDWEACLGASGTIHATRRILSAMKLAANGKITLDGLRALVDVVSERASVAELDLPELKEERRLVLPGGLTVLLAVMEALEIESIQPAPGAMREGLLFDLHGRLKHEDVRDRTIRSFVDRFQIDPRQGERVAVTAARLLAATREAWDLGDPHLGQLLDWAARIHEIGLAISHSAYHRHGEYLVAHATMAGFSDEDQRALAALIRSHRRKVYVSALADIRHVKEAQAVRLCLLLRLAVLLNRSRGSAPAVDVLVTADGNKLTLQFPADWLAQHPLTETDLRKEAGVLSGLGYELVCA